jgi:multiple sugar transport system ATP-binding protein
MTRIRFEHVTKTFGTTLVIKKLDLAINAGEFFTFVGPSGCGKSTILNIIAGLESLTAGLIFFNETVVNGLSPKERDVAMVFQSYALYPHMTVYENIAFPLRMKKEKISRIDGDVKRVAGLLGLDDFLGKKPKELSGGQRQRVALGRAMIRKPKVFLMDEPLSNLDARLRIEMRSEIKKLHRELGVTTVYVTHDQAEAMSLSDRIAVLNEGAIQQCDTPREVYRNPANAFVAGFIGSPAMNFIPCHELSSQTHEYDCFGFLFHPPVNLSTGRGEVIAGIRPEDVIVSSKKSYGSVEVKVTLIEPAGSYNWVDAERDEVLLKGLAKPEEDLKSGQVAYANLSSDKAIFFDAASGRRL